ncbi:hypothetical protein [Nocardia gipuzkoensis]|uniref:hypothetical protein n=1 Tax=Nocardia gipuzkoensis TaxID=2749991 RepID=UPI003B8A5CFE
MTTRYFYDSEFLDDGKTIEPISIGIVCEDGREYYAVNSDMPVERIKKHHWLMENVWPSLPLRGHKTGLKYTGRGDSKHEVGLLEPGVLDSASVLVKPKWVIANEVRDFLLSEGEPQLWAHYPSYDHVLLAQLWGPMHRLPEGIPMRTNDLQQEIERTDGFEAPVQASGHHNALEDARHNLVVFQALCAHQHGALKSVLAAHIANIDYDGCACGDTRTGEAAWRAHLADELTA